jgi:5-methylcytosine-specific restriction endonuclease McrA
MDREREFTVDDRESQLTSDMELMSMLLARVVDNLEWFDSAQIFTADGCRNLSEWVSARLDVGPDTAKRLVHTMRRTVDKPSLRRALGAGVSFDRVEALSKIRDDVGMLEYLDVNGVRRRAADELRLARDEEIRSGEDRFLVMQPSIDRSWWTLYGGLDGLTGAAIDNALTKRADDLPDLPDGTRGSGSWRKATALYEMATGGRLPEAHVTVFVDAEKAASSDGTAGIRLEAGPRVGTVALSAILCNSVTEVTVTSADGVPLKYGRSSRSIPMSLRRAVLARTAGHCAIDGCNSRYRVEVHHKVPWSEGGKTDPENLIALCWFHHHIAVHERGFEVYDHPDHGRIRLRRSADRRRVFDQESERERARAGTIPGRQPTG